MQILIPFNTIIDTDIGLMKLIQFDYRNDTYFNMGLIDTTEPLQQFTAANRDNENIMFSLCSSECTPEMIEDFTEQFFSKEYDEILKLSPLTHIMRIIKMIEVTHSEKDVQLTVLCTNSKQKDLLEHRQIPVNIIQESYSTVNLSNFGVLFVKNVNELGLFNNVEGKLIFVPNYKFNLFFEEGHKDPLIRPDIYMEYAPLNDFRIYPAYVLEDSELPKL